MRSWREPLPERVHGTIRTVLPGSSLQCGPPVRPSSAGLQCGPRLGWVVQPCPRGPFCLQRHRAQGRAAAAFFGRRPYLPTGVCFPWDCPPRQLPPWVRDQLFMFHFHARCVRGALGVDCQRQKPPLTKLAGQWRHLLAHRAKCGEGGAGLALGWLEPGTRVSPHLALTHVCCSSL